jgi:hypothetical protein
MHGRWSMESVGGPSSYAGSVFSPQPPMNNLRAVKEVPMQSPVSAAPAMSSPTLPSRPQPAAPMRNLTGPVNNMRYARGF